MKVACFAAVAVLVEVVLIVVASSVALANVVILVYVVRSAINIW